MTARTSPLGPLVALAMLLVGVAWHLSWASQGWHIPGMSGHEFRQTQTAVTIQRIKADGFKIDYATPILGKPWSIPFEFPIYEGLAARVSQQFNLSVVEAGRWVSMVAFYLALPAFVLIFRRIGYSPIAAVMGMLPIIAAPVYILYTRSVLIESTALCLSAWFFYFLVGYRRTRNPWSFGAALVIGIAAVLTKSTTWAVFCLPWAAWGLSDVWRARKRGWKAWGLISEDVFLLGLPLLAVGFSWVWITDRIKELNPIGGFLTSGNLTAFNFGTVAQHFDSLVWKTLWSHWTSAIMPAWALVLVVVGVVFVPARTRIVVALGVFMFLGGQFLFINLYAIHNYYFYANAVGLCAAAGGMTAGLWDRPGRWYQARPVAFLLLLAICFGEYRVYRKDFYHIQTAENGGTSGLTEVIKRLTKPSDVVVVHSPDWSSMIAFQSGRRTLMIPDSQMFFRPEAVQRSVDLLSDENVSLVIFRGESRVHVDWVIRRIRDFGLEIYPLCTWQDDATVYTTRAAYRKFHEILEQEKFPGVSLEFSGVPDLKEAVPIAGIPGAAEMVMLDPLPKSASLPYGIGFRYPEGKKCFFVHSPTELTFDIPAGASRVELGYLMDQGAYGKPEFDGVFVVVEVVEPGKRPFVLHEDWLMPDGNRKPRYVTVPLGNHNKGMLVFRTLPGPANNNNTAFDWALLEYLRIR
jgi:hypothetical protein